MQPPSGPTGPRVLLTRPIRDLFNHLAKKYKEFTSLQLSPEQHESITRWVEAEFVYSTLRLDGLEVTATEVVRIVSDVERRTIPESEHPDSVLKLVEGFRLLERVVQSEGRAANLSPNLLLKLNPGATTFRNGTGDPNRTRKPIASEHLPAIIESICGWFTADSFTELNPIEQASIAYLRLVEIQPFDAENERIAILGASLFTRRGDLPPLIFTPSLEPVYRGALNESSRGNTQPMVDLMATAVERTLNGMIEQASNAHSQRQ